MITRPEILLCPNVPKPLHGLSPRTVKGGDWWDGVRYEAYCSTDYHCAACGMHKREAKYHQWLEAHEMYEIDYCAGLAVMIEIVPLCHSCHNYIHDGRMRMLLANGDMSFEKYNDILEYGDGILEPYLEEKGKAFDKSAAMYAYSELLVLCIELELPFVKCWSVGSSVAWEDWRLVLDGKEYKPRHKSFDDWVAYYRR